MRDCINNVMGDSSSRQNRGFNQSFHGDSIVSSPSHRTVVTYSEALRQSSGSLLSLLKDLGLPLHR